MKVLAYIICFTAALIAGACRGPVQPAAGPVSEEKKEHAIQEQFVKANQLLALKENDEMDYYGRTHKMPFVKTGSGVRYFVYGPSLQGDSIRDGMEVTMDYKVSLLDGTLCYSSEESGPLTFMVGKNESVESGMHKGIQYLKRGDKAILLIPSVLAHGLLGDSKKIPPQMPIVYEVRIH